MSNNYRKTPIDVLTSRFSKALVKAQLEHLTTLFREAMTGVEKKEGLDIWTDQVIHRQWLGYSTNPEERPRFILLKDSVWDYGPMHILLSEYSSNIVNGIPHEIIKIGHRHNTFAFVNIPKSAAIALGGEPRIARLLVVGGLRLVIDEIKRTQGYLTGAIGHGIIRDLERFLEIETAGMGL